LNQVSSAAILFLIFFAAQVRAQNPTAAPATPPAAVSRPAFPQRSPVDPALLERGKALYGVNCNFCHGSDARGGEGGPNLLRSELVLNDQKGELIFPVVQNGRGEMPKINLTSEQVSDIATFIHSFKVGGYDISRMVPPSILVGDARAGEAVFKSKCAACHSVTGDLKGLATKIPDPKVLQNTFLLPSRGGSGPSPLNVPPTTVTVTDATGRKTDGSLLRIDDFIVTLRNADGDQQTFRRDGGQPKVEIHDPLKPHRDLLPAYTDREIHDLTSYLVTLK
jgi:cytochrome c oxidase cbb3-type subunit 3